MQLTYVTHVSEGNIAIDAINHLEQERGAATRIIEGLDESEPSEIAIVFNSHADGVASWIIPSRDGTKFQHDWIHPDTPIIIQIRKDPNMIEGLEHAIRQIEDYVVNRRYARGIPPSGNFPNDVSSEAHRCCIKHMMHIVLIFEGHNWVRTPSLTPVKRRRTNGREIWCDNAGSDPLVDYDLINDQKSAVAEVEAIYNRS